MPVSRMKLSVRGAAVPVAFNQFGHGDAIVLVHGWAHTKEIWQRVIPLVSNENSRIIAIDLPGFGESPAPVRELQSIAGYSEILNEFLVQIESNTSVRAIVADSLGARIVFESLGRNYQGACSKFLLSGCPFTGLPTALSILSSTRVIGLLLSLIQALPRSLGEAVIRSFAWYTIRKRKGNMEPIYEGVVRSNPSTAEIFLRALNSPARPIRQNSTTRFRLTLLRGRYDRVVSAKSQKRWAKLLDAKSVTVPAVGHSPMVEAPEAYASAIKELMS